MVVARYTAMKTRQGNAFLLLWPPIPNTEIKNRFEKDPGIRAVVISNKKVQRGIFEEGRTKASNSSIVSRASTYNLNEYRSRHVT